MRSCAADPGAVFSNIWNNDAFFGSPPMRTVLGAVYAPPRDGAVAVVLAALAPFSAAALAAAAAAVAAAATVAAEGGGGTGWSVSNKREGGAAAAAAAAAAEVDDLRFRFYARGLFASAFVTRFAPGTRGGGSGSIAGSAWECVWWAHMGLWGAGTLLCSALDWPARRCSGGRMAGATAEVLSSPGSYDARIAGDLWDVAGDAAGL